MIRHASVSATPLRRLSRELSFAPKDAKSCFWQLLLIHSTRIDLQRPVQALIGSIDLSYMLASRIRPFLNSPPFLSFSMPSSCFPSYLLHAPFLAVQPADKSTPTPSLPLLQRTLPPSPLYYLHTAPETLPGAPPPVLSLLPKPPIPGRISTVYRAVSQSGAKVILKQTSTNFLELLKEAEEVYVNLPGGSLPIPTFWGIFQGGVEAGRGGMVTVLEDCGEPLEGNSFDSLTKPERYNPLFLFRTSPVAYTDTPSS